MKKGQFAFIIILSIFALAESCFACAVCFTNKGNAREAFIWTTALMTFVPLIMIGGGVVIIRKLLKEDPTQIETSSENQLSNEVNESEPEEAGLPK